jgi:uncharacterized membrane protein
LQLLVLETQMATSYAESFSAPVTTPNVGNVERMITAAAGAALLGLAWRRRSRGLGMTSAGLLARAATGYCPAYAAMGVNHADSRHALAGARGIHIRESVTVGAPPEQVYKFWRSLVQLPEVMPHLERIDVIDDTLSRWTAKAFGSVPLTWQAEIISDVPASTIGWRTLPGEAIQHAGSVTFKSLPGTGGTEVRVHLQYAPPGGRAAAWFAELLGQDPDQMTRDGLQALKDRFTPM